MIGNAQAFACGLVAPDVWICLRNGPRGMRSCTRNLKRLTITYTLAYPCLMRDGHICSCMAQMSSPSKLKVIYHLSSFHWTLRRRRTSVVKSGVPLEPNLLYSIFYIEPSVKSQVSKGFCYCPCQIPTCSYLAFQVVSDQPFAIQNG